LKYRLSTLQAGLYTIYGSLHTELSEEAVLDVLTDYEGLARIYNNIQASQLLQSGSQKQVLQVYNAFHISVLGCTVEGSLS
jgi:hypothetical protein